MKFWPLGILIGTIACLFMALGNPRAFAQPAIAAPESSAIGSALWLHAQGSPYRDTVRLRRLAEELRALPFEQIIVQVHEEGRAFYRSETLPRAVGVSESFDPLAELIRLLHDQEPRRKVFAAVAPFAAGNANDASPDGIGRLLEEHSDWFMRNRDGERIGSGGAVYFEPGIEAARQHIAELIVELVRHYELDGLYLDPVADPAPDWGYHPELLRRWRSETGRAGTPAPDDSAWIEFRARILSEALASIARAVRNAKPGLMIAVGAAAEGSAPASVQAFERSRTYRESHQNWPHWLADGVVDRVYVKNFRNEEETGEAFTAWTEFAVNLADRTPGEVYIGVAGYLNTSLAALRQLQTAATAGAAGVALADFQQLTREAGNRQPFLNAVAQTALSPDYVSEMREERPRLETIAAKTRPPAGTGASSTGESASMDEIVRTSLPTEETREEADSETAMTLPPPPAIEVEEGRGEVLSMDDDSEGRSGTPDQTSNDLEMLQEVAGLQPTRDGDTGVSAEQQRPMTRRELLLELLQARDMDDLRREPALRPSQRAEEFLRSRFQNTFDRQRRFAIACF